MHDDNQPDAAADRTRPSPAAEPATDPSVLRTGDPDVDAAVRRLAALDPRAPAAEQLPELVAVHEALQQRLSAAVE
ncbi:hypothetical protein HJG43_05210 [Kineosporiaceae bacterium SCSIO 59966]|nr:hypothetical protein HJG43_05210 [Kineosporiaceae bacterium SCSIO 59966]